MTITTMMRMKAIDPAQNLNTSVFFVLSSIMWMGCFSASCLALVHPKLVHNHETSPSSSVTVRAVGNRFDTRIRPQSLVHLAQVDATADSEDDRMISADEDVLSTQRQMLTSLLDVDDDDDDDVPLQEARAGRSGYSLNRQPIQRNSWDVDQDPTFNVPKALQTDDGTGKGRATKIDMEWWSSKKSSSSSFFDTPDPDGKMNGPNKYTDVVSSSSSPLDVEDIMTDDSMSMTLDLRHRSYDTLDFPMVLNALRSHCSTVPARQVIDEATTTTTTTAPKTDSGTSRDEQNKCTLIADTPESAQQRYQGIREMRWLLFQMADDGRSLRGLLQDAYYKSRMGYKVSLSSPPIMLGHTDYDLESILDIAENQGRVLEGPDLLEISVMMNSFEDIQLWSRGLSRLSNEVDDDGDDDNSEENSNGPFHFVELPRIANGIELNTTLQSLLEDAFDENSGQLSSKTFPKLGELRSKIRTLKSDILKQLDELVQLPSIRSKLALESGGPLYSEVSAGSGGGRLVIPVNAKFASAVGRVHDSSRSGRTVYVEPNEIIEPTNNLRQIERQLQKEEERIWRQLTEQILLNSRGLRRSIQAVSQLDLAVACCRLGEQLGETVIPTVGSEGVISLQNAKHPVLLIRQSRKQKKAKGPSGTAPPSVVVGSDIMLGKDGNQGLVLTGPNSGGKTVILKLLGLCALMARCGIPIPASPPSALQRDESYIPRVDFFDPVLADIGDIQSVGSDLSTFSGHMLVCREVLSEAQSGQNALVLMDELGSGTDPAQGVAIAQAILEALLDTGCRVAITTHYTALKQLATSDDRFAVGGMQFLGGRPTYKLLPGTIGESFALAVAERLKLPQSVLDRANDLLDSETRQMGDLIRDLEDQKALIDAQVSEIEERKKEIVSLEMKMKEEQIRLEKKMLTARRDEAKKFAKKLEEKEQILEDILEKLKKDPSRKLIAKSWDSIKVVKREAIDEAENVPSVLKARKNAEKAAEQTQRELVPLSDLPNRPLLKVNDVLTVCMKGALLGREAKVISDNGKTLEVNVSGLSMTLKHKDLSMVPSGGATTSTGVRSDKTADGQKTSRLSKSVEMALMSESNGRGNSRGSVDDAERPKKRGIAMRTDSNTVDVRGCNLEAAQEKIQSKISECMMSGHSSIYVLHGHGSGGVLKSKLRNWFKSETRLIMKYAPADGPDGGDAFTRLELS